MIAKTIKGKGFRGVLEYDAKDGSVQIDTNLAGQSSREMAKEFGAVRRLRPGISKPVVHVSLTLPPGEHLTDNQWKDAARKWLHGMSHEDCQFVVTRHVDTDHEHVHIITSRVSMGGEVVSDSNDFKRSENIMRALEKEYGLKQVEPSNEAIKKAPRKGEIEETIRTGQPSTRAQLQQICDRAAADCSTIGEYINRLQSLGIAVTATTQANDTKLVGLLLELEGTKLKTSDLGKAYTPNGLLKRGINYDKDRDFETVCRANADLTQRSNHGTDRGIEGDGSGEHQPTVERPDTTSRSDGGLDPIDIRDHDRIPRNNQRTDPNTPADEGRGTNAFGTQNHFTSAIGFNDHKSQGDNGINQPTKYPRNRTVQRVISGNASVSRRTFGIGDHGLDGIFAALNCGITSADNHTAEQKAKLRKRYTEQLALKLKDAKLTYTKAGLIIYHRGGRAVDKGDSVTIDKITSRNISLMLDIAEGKGWRKLSFTGSEEFCKLAAIEALKRGFELDDPELTKYAQEYIAANASSISPTQTTGQTTTAKSFKEQVSADLAAAVRASASTPQQIAANKKAQQVEQGRKRELGIENDLGHYM